MSLQLHPPPRVQEEWELPAFIELPPTLDAPAAAKEASLRASQAATGEALDDMCMDHAAPQAALRPSRAHTCGMLLLRVAQGIEVRGRSVALRRCTGSAALRVNLTGAVARGRASAGASCASCRS